MIATVLTQAPQLLNLLIIVQVPLSFSKLGQVTGVLTCEHLLDILLQSSLPSLLLGESLLQLSDLLSQASDVLDQEHVVVHALLVVLLVNLRLSLDSLLEGGI